VKEGETTNGSFAFLTTDPSAEVGPYIQLALEGARGCIMRAPWTATRCEGLDPSVEF